MERRPNPSEVRRAEHNRIAANARELGRKAFDGIEQAIPDNNAVMRQVDAVNRVQEDVWEEMQRWAGCDGLTDHSLVERLRQTIQSTLPNNDSSLPPVIP